MRSRQTIVIACAVLSTCLFARGDEIAVACRAVSATHANAVVRVRAVFKESYSYGGTGDSSESTSEIPGTIVGPDGTTVVSLYNIDMEAMYEEYEMEDDDGPSLNMDSKLTDAKILLATGKEIPAQVVLRDKDLDLAILKPLSPPEKPLAYVDLAAGGPAEAFDQVVLIERMGKVAGRVCTAYESRIAAVREKPRKNYIVAAGSLGIPAFTLDQKLLGIVVMRRIKGAAEDAEANMLTGMMDNQVTVVLPARDVLNVVNQAGEVGEEAVTAGEDAGEDSECAAAESKATENAPAGAPANEPQAAGDSK